MGARVSRMMQNEGGSVLLEALISIFVLIFMVFGIIEFSYLFYQWNSITKAAQLGARYAATSPPVAGVLSTINDSSVGAGDSYSSGFTYELVCTSTAATIAANTGSTTTSCTCSPTSVCPSGALPSATAMNDIVRAMQKSYSRINPVNVSVTYSYTKLGYAGRPGGPVPTITVGLRNLTFPFVLLSAVLPRTITLPPFSTTATGEDMKYGP